MGEPLVLAGVHKFGNVLGIDGSTYRSVWKYAEVHGSMPKCIEVPGIIRKDVKVHGNSR